jgi:membrane protein
MTVKSLWQILKDTFKDFGEDRAMRLAAAMAYYSIFSLGPLLFVAITVAGWVMGEEAVRGQVQQQLKGFIGEQSAKIVESMMAGPKLGQNILATVIGIGTLLLGAGGLFGQLQDALNTIWEVKPKPGRGIWGLIRSRFLSMAMVLGLGFLLLISMVLTTTAEAATAQAGQILPIPDAVVGMISVAVSFLVVTLFFAIVYKVLPDVKVRLRDVWMGAIFAAVLFTVGKYLLSLYLGKQATSSTYGTAGAFVVILLWVYYSSIILFLGSEFAQVYAHRRGAALAPTKDAVPVTEDERAQQGMPSPEQVKPQTQPRPAPTPQPAGRFRPSMGLWLGFGVLASWWFKKHRGKA